MLKRTLLLSLIIIVIDQAIKFLIAYLIPLNHYFYVIMNFFYLTYVKNFGAAWNILEGNRVFLIIVAMLSLGMIYYLFLKDKHLSKLDSLSYSLLIGGIIGNLIDRILWGHVVDYLGFNLWGYHFPIFNLADICIVLSFILIIYNLKEKGEKHE